MHFSPRLQAFTAGALTGLLTLTPAAPLSVVPLAAWLGLAARRDTAARMGWGAFGYTGAHLWWVMALAAQIFGAAPAGALAWLLYAAEGAFFAGLGWAVGRLCRSPRGRLWALAGGWVWLEYLRTLGTLAFPWPTLGAAWLDTPVIQVADLGGVLLVSGLSTALAAALADWRTDRRPLLAALTALALAAGYGLSRVPGVGTPADAYLTRTDVDSFQRRAGGQLLPALLEASAARPAGQPVIWSETAIRLDLGEAALFPGPGISGAGSSAGGLNAVVALNSSGQVVGENRKGRPVPFGETFPLQSLLRPLYAALGPVTGYDLLSSIQPAQRMVPLDLEGVRYGAYVCYDSVFGWPARQLTRQGAEVLVNVSNDSWFAAAGVKQHFDLGRIRAIENRRWVLRSVQRGWAGSIDDLGHVRQLVNRAEPGQLGTGFSVTYQRLSGETLYTRWGNWLALLLAGTLVAAGGRLDSRSQRDTHPEPNR